MKMRSWTWLGEENLGLVPIGWSGRSPSSGAVGLSGPATKSNFWTWLKHSRKFLVEEPKFLLFSAQELLPDGRCDAFCPEEGGASRRQDEGRINGVDRNGWSKVRKFFEIEKYQKRPWAGRSQHFARNKSLSKFLLAFSRMKQPRILNFLENCTK